METEENIMISGIRCQSLGNSFLLFDLRDKTQQEVQPAHKLCQEHKTDGVLHLLHNTEHDLPEVMMFNADGSDGQVCLNGARCVANYLREQHNAQEEINLLMADKTISHAISTETGTITQFLPLGKYHGTKFITCDAGEFNGHVVDVGNPHYILFEETTPEWLEKNGHHIETHEAFENRTNVEFVWLAPEKTNEYHVLVYERGCGVTKGCSSGAAAIMQLLFETSIISYNKAIQLCMPGGTLMSWVTSDDTIALKTP